MEHSSFHPSACYLSLPFTVHQQQQLIFIIRWTYRWFHTSEWRRMKCCGREKKAARNAIIFQYFMSYHLHSSDMFQNALVIFAYFAAAENSSSFSHRKIKIFHSINHVGTSPSVRKRAFRCATFQGWDSSRKMKWNDESISWCINCMRLLIRWNSSDKQIAQLYLHQADSSGKKIHDDEKLIKEAKSLNRT